MRKSMHCFIIGIGLFLCLDLYGYRYTFSNHTDIPIFVAIKLCCLFEDLIIKLVQPHKMITFVHGKDFPNIKFGYCLQSISYIENPTEEDIADPETAPWKEINFTWEKSDTYEDSLEFAEAVGSGVEEGAQAITELAMHVSTGGATVPISAVAGGAHEVASITKPNTKPYSPKKRSFGLGRITRGLTKLIFTSTCRDRHWDIFENEDKSIIFVSKIQQ